MKTKICVGICELEKPLSEFHKQSDCLFGVYPECKICCAKQQRERHKKQPWKRTFYNIKQRCINPNNQDYKNYGLRGIKCLITVEELKFLWYRDKAYLMDKPSIDRKDNDGNYELSNCRFIEMDINSAKDKRKCILQFDLENNFIKEFDSITAVENILGICNQNIGKCAKNKRKSAGGFIWKYKTF